MWMQSQSLLTKLKLWGAINENIKPGRYSILADNNYGVNNMRINKGVQLSESSYFGGKSYSIPAIFLIFSIACLVYAIVFFRKFKDLDAVLEEEKKER